MASHGHTRKNRRNVKVHNGRKNAKSQSLPSIKPHKDEQHQQRRHKPRVYTVAHSFTATHIDELSVQRFQKVVGKSAVQGGEPEDEQWIIVENEYGATGLVPMVILEEETEPEPVCSREFFIFMAHTCPRRRRLFLPQSVDLCLTLIFIPVFRLTCEICYFHAIVVAGGR